MFLAPSASMRLRLGSTLLTACPNPPTSPLRDARIPGCNRFGALVHLFMRLFGHAGVTGWNWRSFGVTVLRSVILLVILHLVRGGGRAGLRRC